MAQVQHPTLSRVFNTVPDDQLGNWLAAGWLECPPEVDGQEPPHDVEDDENNTDTPGV